MPPSATRTAPVRRWPQCFVAAALALLVGPATAFAMAEADPASRATVLCARAIAKTGSAVARKQLVGLGGCLDRMLQCLDAKPGDQVCLDRRGADQAEATCDEDCVGHWSPTSGYDILFF